jgi:serine protease AprX
MRYLYLILALFLWVNLLHAGESGRFWIYFKDKITGQNSGLLKNVDTVISERALKRRQLRAPSMITHNTDLPVSPIYINHLESLGIRIHRQSRWLNAASCYLNGVDISVLINLPFIKKIEPVHSFSSQPAKKNAPPPDDSTDYGSSLNQIEMIGIPAAHAAGFSGEGVLIAIFDTGFILDHEALSHIKVVAEWDFVNNDAVVANESGDLVSQHDHGTEVLGVMAGYKPGRLIGPAYNSDFILGKTEDIGSESHIEEDNWVAAAEWAESLGADIISTSVGYDDLVGYTYQDMDGNTAIITKAADMAVRKGVSVFASAGNEGLSAWKYIIAPADGDSVIAMGGVRPEKTRWPSSSHGPTYDGRIKPDLMAQAENVYSVNPRTIDQYISVSGTSFSCPLGAGAGAILLSAMPSLSPIALRDTLTGYATRFNNPDTLYGYGLIDLEKILTNVISEPGVSVRNLEISSYPGRNIIEWISVRELSNEKWIISRKEGLHPFKKIGELEGKEISQSPQTYSFVDLDVQGGESFTYQLSAQLKTGELITIDSLQVQSVQPEDITLLYSFPNPFNSTVRIILGLNHPKSVNLKIFDVSGRLVKTILENMKMSAQYHHFIWDATNDSGRPVSSGSYFIQVIADDTQKMMKMLYLK